MTAYVVCAFVPVALMCIAARAMLGWWRGRREAERKQRTAVEQFQDECRAEDVRDYYGWYFKQGGWSDAPEQPGKRARTATGAATLSLQIGGLDANLPTIDISARTIDMVPRSHFRPGIFEEHLDEAAKRPPVQSEWGFGPLFAGIRPFVPKKAQAEMHERIAEQMRQHPDRAKEVLDSMRTPDAPKVPYGSKPDESQKPVRHDAHVALEERVAELERWVATELGNAFSAGVKEAAIEDRLKCLESARAGEGVRAWVDQWNPGSTLLSVDGLMYRRNSRGQWHPSWIEEWMCVEKLPRLSHAEALRLDAERRGQG